MSGRVRLGLLLLALGLPCQVQALTWTWDPVTTNTKGAPIQVDSYRFYYSSDNLTWARFQCPEQSTDPNLLQRMCTLASPPMGQRWYTVTALSKEGESERALALGYFLQNAPPQAPTGLREKAASGSAAPRVKKHR